MLALVPTVPSMFNAGSLAVVAVLVLVAIWLIRRVLKALLILGVVALLAASALNAGNREEYVADTSVFLDYPGSGECRVQIDRRYLDNPSVTLLVATPTVFLASIFREALRPECLGMVRPCRVG
jgi:hypothetical protein